MASKVTECVSFYLGKPNSDQPNLILQRDATATEGKIRLTKVDAYGVPVRHSLGRALHVTPVHIWDSETGKTASFFTCFSFTIHAQNVDKTADGLAFFLARMDDKPKSGGGFLGIFNDAEDDQIVAVEFDTYINKDDGIDDPDYIHIGIDVMNINSTNNVPWDLESDREAIVYISYDGTSPDKTLKTTLVYPESDPATAKHYQVSTPGVNLKKSLPNWVRVGFSAYAGLPDTHDVHSWYFASAFGQNTVTLAEQLKTLNPDLAKYLDLHFKPPTTN